MALELSMALAAPPGGGLLLAPPPPAPPGKEQQVAGVGILLQISMLVLSFVLGHVLRRHRFYYLPEASASLLIGMFFFHSAHPPQAEAGGTPESLSPLRLNPNPGRRLLVPLIIS
jgi:hypothetical protein